MSQGTLAVSALAKGAAVGIADVAVADVVSVPARTSPAAATSLPLMMTSLFAVERWVGEGGAGPAEVDRVVQDTRDLAEALDHCRGAVRVADGVQVGARSTARWAASAALTGILPPQIGCSAFLMRGRRGKLRRRKVSVGWVRLEACCSPMWPRPRPPWP